jgi:hypothetical protein
MKFTRRICAISGPVLFAAGLTVVSCGGAKQSAPAREPSGLATVMSPTVASPGSTETSVTATPIVSERSGVTNVQPNQADIPPFKAPVREGACLSKAESCSRSMDCCSQWCLDGHCANRNP